MFRTKIVDAAVPVQLSRLDCERDSDQLVPNSIRVLIADDNADAARLLYDCLASEGWSCEIASSADNALNIVQKYACDAVIGDVLLLGLNDFDLLKHIKALQPALPVIVGSAASSLLEAVEAGKHGAFQYLKIPYDIAELHVSLTRATEDLQRNRKTIPPPLRGLPVLDSDIVHVSSVMRELVESIVLVARSNAAVLILGESGTGKERVARAIHTGGSRAGSPFVAVNTSAIPEQLLESEVFGHVRGAFTGATQARRGLLMEAHGGTLLLDEIGDMPLSLQPKLLRVLQFGETRPVGSDRIGHVDVRIIAATHRDLTLLVKEGRFREDLRYRLNVIPLLVPPLRERREDIPILVKQFLQEARARTSTSPVDTISDEAMNVMLQAPWPGNVRELENAIERLVVLG